MPYSAAPKAGLISFGDGSLAYRRAVKRVINQSEAFSRFDVKVALTKKDLVRDCYEESKLVNWNEPFLGYFAWKPLVLKWAAANFPADIDVIYYVDSGTWANVNKYSKIKLNGYLADCYENGGLVFSSGYFEINFTKMEVLDALNAEPDYINSLQVSASQWLLRRDVALELSDQWWAFASSDFLIGNSFNPDIQNPGFVGCRHDQSIFSLLVKKLNLPMSDDFVEIHPAKIVISSNEKSIPFWTARHRSGSHSMSMHPIRRALRAIEQSIP